MVLLPMPPPGGFTAGDLPRLIEAVENIDDAMVVYSFELLPEGSYAPTGVFHSRIKLDRPFAIDIEVPEVTW